MLVNQVLLIQYLIMKVVEYQKMGDVQNILIYIQLVVINNVLLIHLLIQILHLLENAEIDLKKCLKTT